MTNQGEIKTIKFSEVCKQAQEIQKMYGSNAPCTYRDTLKNTMWITEESGFQIVFEEKDQ